MTGEDQRQQHATFSQELDNTLLSGLEIVRKVSQALGLHDLERR